MRIVVTGGAGFIGANLCRTLLAEGHEVVALDDLSSGSAANLAGTEARLVTGSILSAESLDQACDGAHAIAHLAALGSVPRSVAEPLPTLAANATGTAMVLEAARRHGGLLTVLAGSSSVYGANPALPKHEGLVPQPLSPYAASKLATETYALAWSRSYGLPVLPFRFFNVFGPLQSPHHIYAAVVPRFVAAALAGEPLIIYGDGQQSRDFTYVGTVAGLLAEALTTGVAVDGPVNLAFGSRVTLLQLVAELSDLLSTPLTVRHEPERAGDVRHSQAANDRLMQLFPHAQPVPLREGLRATVEWMQAQREGAS
ncbi:MAG: NAD-dependent epimerase/dehydratase family protein [Actinomycetota bacterium]|nr:NAD-dependent epimerase/dehydratase family protein [Actinomycetota bacterium]